MTEPHTENIIFVAYARHTTVHGPSTTVITAGFNLAQVLRDSFLPQNTRFLNGDSGCFVEVIALEKGKIYNNRWSTSAPCIVFSKPAKPEDGKVWGLLTPQNEIPEIFQAELAKYFASRSEDGP